MKRAMLKNENTAIYADDVVMRESLLQGRQCQFVLIGLVVGRHQYCMVDDEEIGISGRKPIAFFIVARVGQWKRVEGVRLFIRSAERMKFRFHGLQFLVVLIGRVVALNIGNGGGRTKAGNSINVPICIITSKPRMMQP